MVAQSSDARPRQKGSEPLTDTPLKDRPWLDFSASASARRTFLGYRYLCCQSRFLIFNKSREDGLNMSNHCREHESEELFWSPWSSLDTGLENLDMLFLHQPSFLKRLSESMGFVLSFGETVRSRGETRAPEWLQFSFGEFGGVRLDRFSEKWRPECRNKNVGDMYARLRAPCAKRKSKVESTRPCRQPMPLRHFHEESPPKLGKSLYKKGQTIQYVFDANPLRGCTFTTKFQEIWATRVGALFPVLLVCGQSVFDIWRPSALASYCQRPAVNSMKNVLLLPNAW